MAGPLDGLLVVTLEQAVAAPYCTSRLADAGARVIKIEREGGDFARAYDSVVHGESAYFVWLNRGKESIVLDIKDDDDRALLRRMIAGADVFVQNLIPGAADRAGFGGEALREAHPHLITVDISGYAEEGPSKDMKAYDMLVQAETGLASITGTPEAPGRVGVSVCDIAAGMYAYSAILEAVISRRQTGTGQGIKVSLFDGMADWMAVPLLHNDYGGEAPGRVGLRHPSIAPYSSFRCADGGLLVLSIQNEREWASFAADILGRPEYATEGPYSTAALRVENVHRLEAEIQSVFDRYDREAMAARLLNAGIAFGRVNSVAEFSGHPDLRRVEVATETGPAAIPAPPARLTGVLREPGPVPSLGEHGSALRREFGA